MKKFFAFLLASVLLLTALLSFVSCSSSKNGVSIDFNKKYMLDDDRYYVFKSDNTGYAEYHYVYVSDRDPAFGYTQSGRIEFEWREANNGAVYLFEVETTYNKDNTEGEKISLIDAPIYFGEDFFAYTTHGSYTTTTCYIKEGSKLEKALDD